MAAIKVDASASTAVYRSFVAWARSGDVRVCFMPDPAIAVDGSDRRGYLLDEVYFITLWASHGFDDLLVLLDAELVDKGRPLADLRRRSDEPGAEEVLEVILSTGISLEQAGGLL